MADEAKTKKYTLKPGMKHSYIENGERKAVVGDGTLTIPLNDHQALAFKDKLMKSDAPAVTEDAVEATKTGEPKNGASSGASAASQGVPNAADKEEAKVVEADKSETKDSKK